MGAKQGDRTCGGEGARAEYTLELRRADKRRAHPTSSHIRGVVNNAGDPSVMLRGGRAAGGNDAPRELKFTENKLRQIAAVRKERRSGIRGFDHAAGKVISAPRFQEIRALTLTLTYPGEAGAYGFFNSVQHLL